MPQHFSRELSEWETLIIEGKLYKASQYVALAAGSTTVIGTTGAYLERVTVIPVSTGAGVVTISDGTTAIASIPAAAHLRGTSATAGFKVVLGASVSCIAVGKFSAD